jgi:hypothetical protein
MRRSSLVCESRAIEPIAIAVTHHPEAWETGREYAVMAAMTMAVAELLDDVDALKAMIVAMIEQRVNCGRLPSWQTGTPATPEDSLARSGIEGGFFDDKRPGGSKVGPVWRTH